MTYPNAQVQKIGIMLTNESSNVVEFAMPLFFSLVGKTRGRMTAPQRLLLST